MASVTVINVYEELRQEKPASVYSKDGKEIKFPARSEGVAKCALVEINDGSGCRVNVEFPIYHRAIKAGDVLMVDCSALKMLERPLIVRNISRHTEGLKK